MKTIIETDNYIASDLLSKLIYEKSESLLNADEDILFIEFNLSCSGPDFICTLVLVIAGSKNVIITKQSDKMIISVLNAVVYAERNLRHSKLQQGLLHARRKIELRSFRENEEGRFDFSAN